MKDEAILNIIAIVCMFLAYLITFQTLGLIPQLVDLSHPAFLVGTVTIAFVFTYILLKEEEKQNDEKS